MNSELSDSKINLLFNGANREVASLIGDSATLVKRGRVTAAIGTTLRVVGVDVSIGQQCEIIDSRSGCKLMAEVVGLDGDNAILLPLGNLLGIATGAEVHPLEVTAKVKVSESLLGRVLDGLGQPIDDRDLPTDCYAVPLYREAPNPLSRRLIEQPFATGIRVIDSMLTIGQGQRVGIFASAGAGKSTLLGMLAQHTSVDIVVVGLIGERGREVSEFIEHSLGRDGIRKSVIVVATSDRPPVERVRAAHTATAIAEAFRDEGKHVLLLVDSITRFSRALREIGLAAGEPAVRQGFPPSVFAELPRLFERAGSNNRGAITAFYTVLVEDDDTTDPIAEEVRSILDGHIILSRKLARLAQYPAVDINASSSRVFRQVTEEQHQQATNKVRSLISKYDEIEFLIQVGEFQRGADSLADEAIDKKAKIQDLFRQEIHKRHEFGESIELLTRLAND